MDLVAGSAQGYGGRETGYARADDDDLERHCSLINTLPPGIYFLSGF